MSMAGTGMFFDYELTLMKTNYFYGGDGNTGMGRGIF